MNEQEQMNALVYTATLEQTYRLEPKPQPKAGHSLVAVEATAICGSDMHAYHGHDERRVPPLILGHEVCGRAETGPLAGQRVVINPLISCGECRDCLAGQAHLCSHRELIGMRLAGAYAEYVCVPDDRLIAVPDNVSAYVAAITEPTATALHAVERVVRVSLVPIADARCLVIGGGAIGLLAMLVMQAKGCQQIVLAETNALRAKSIKQAGEVVVLNPLVEDIPNAGDYDVILDCVGSGHTRAMACEQVRPGGVISHVGLQNNDEGLDTRRLTLQEVTWLGNYCYSHADMEAALQLLVDGQLGDLSWLEQRSLRDGAQAFRDLHEGQVGAAKIVLLPDGRIGNSGTG